MLANRKWLVLILLIAGLQGAQAAAASVRTVNLPEMVRLADRVFYGHCLEVQETSTPNSGFPVTEYRFRVLRGIKGVEDGQLVTVRQLSAKMLLAGTAGGLPTYRKGQSLLLFLHGDSRLGLTSPVGMLQGTFKPVEADDGDLAFLNPLDNWNLSFGLGAAEAAEAGLDSVDLSRIRPGVPLAVGELEDMVRRIWTTDQAKENAQ